MPLSTQVAGRLLTLEECIAIALEAQPRIQATLADYAAARYRVNQAFSPLLPQLAGSVGATKSQIPTVTTSALGPNITINQSRGFGDTLLAQVQLSQLLFDFGKTLAATDAARKLAEVAVENVELQRQLISLTVKEAYTNTLFSQRLIRVQEQAVERAELNLRSAKGFFDVGTRPKSDVARAEVDVANAKVDLIRARNALRQAIVALNIAMAIDARSSAPIRFASALNTARPSCRRPPPKPWSARPSATSFRTSPGPAPTAARRRRSTRHGRWAWR
jgi:outer membrane protein TolC